MPALVCGVRPDPYIPARFGRAYARALARRRAGGAGGRRPLSRGWTVPTSSTGWWSFLGRPERARSPLPRWGDRYEPRFGSMAAHRDSRPAPSGEDGVLAHVLGHSVLGARSRRRRPARARLPDSPHLRGISRQPPIAASCSRDTFATWDTGWYAAHGHWLPGYSLLSPALGALLGVRLLLALSALLAVALFAMIAERVFGRTAGRAAAAGVRARVLRGAALRARPYYLGFAMGSARCSR